MARHIPQPPGLRFGRLITIEPTKGSKMRVLCRCDCGREKAIWLTTLRQGTVQSCGCLQKQARFTHGQTKTAEYRVWSQMLERCRNPNDKGFHRYGGRGITVCEQWNDFAAFLCDMGERPSGDHSIERIDNDRGYEPTNCRWELWKAQCRNMRTNRIITIDHVKSSVAEWAEIMGVNVHLIHGRLYRGWPDRAAVLAPPGQSLAAYRRVVGLPTEIISGEKAEAA